MAESLQSVSPLKETQTYANIEEALQALDIGQDVDPMEFNRLAKEKQGSYECEFCLGDESNLHKFFNCCDKNPGHENFIPVNEMSMENLPEGYRKAEYFDLIHCQAALTVKITTFYMNITRCAKWKLRGRKFTQKATGFVIWVSHVKAKEGETCSCDKCKESENPCNSWYQFEILTAKHVVFDQVEADCLIVEFSYYNDSDKSKVVKRQKGKCLHSNSGDDVCKLTMIMHDDDLYSKMYSCLDYMYNFKLSESPEPGSFAPWQAIVSHPHGLEKHVSFGRVNVDLQRGTFSMAETSRLTSITYDTPTCPGTSGARVLILCRDAQVIMLAHSGVEDEASNKSALIALWLTKEEKSDNIILYQGALAAHPTSGIQTAYVGVYETYAPNGIQIFLNPHYKAVGVDDESDS